MYLWNLRVTNEWNLKKKIARLNATKRNIFLVQVRQVIHGDITRSLLDNLCTVILGDPTEEDYTSKVDTMSEVSDP